MIREIKKTVTEMVDVKLSEPKYVCYADTIFYRFIPVKNSILVTYVTVGCGGLFQVQVRNEPLETDYEALFLEGKDYKEISAAEFYKVINDNALLYGLIADVSQGEYDNIQAGNK